MVSWQLFPLIIGPFTSWSECASVREFLDRRDFESDGCETLPVPQDSEYLEVGYLPYEIIIHNPVLLPEINYN